ncbi:MAG: hypothetical protein Q9163_003874 [Psora crenata]
MDVIDQKVERLRSQVAAVETLLSDLKEQLAEAERTLASRTNEACTTVDPSSEQVNGWRGGGHSNSTESQGPEDTSSSDQTWSMPLDDYKRYGRQMILPQIGLQGQLSLRSARVLIIGLGGLGCPAAMYLAGAGVGTMGLMDGDTVELSNLHRQCLHTTARVGWRKVTSAVEALKGINPHVNYRLYPYDFTTDCALDIVEEDYDLVLDCTDNPMSRYLISDIAVLAGKPLISASALKTEGQLLVLNYPAVGRTKINANTGHCYRCVFPRPPPPEYVGSCGEGGILGPVVGLMGTLMATEAIKILTATEVPSPATSTMVLYSAYSERPFRIVQLAGKRSSCHSCSDRPAISRRSLKDGSLNYTTFCGFSEPRIVPAESRMSPDEFQCSRLTEKSADKPILIDVRSENEFKICHLPFAINIPLADIRHDPRILQPWLLRNRAKCHDTVFVCRYGNDSREAVEIGKQLVKTSAELGIAAREFEIRDVKGGLKAWKDEVDPTFPEY